MERLGRACCFFVMALVHGSQWEPKPGVVEGGGGMQVLQNADPIHCLFRMKPSIRFLNLLRSAQDSSSEPRRAS